MTQRPPLVLCSGTLGSAPLADKFRAAASAGFELVSVYGQEYHAARAAGIDVAGLAFELGLRIAEVDGVATSLSSAEAFEDALAIAVDLGARSITIVETSDFDRTGIAAAAKTFGDYCDLAADHSVLVHLEPFAWSSLGRTDDAMQIAEEADRDNGGVLLDLWHHLRGPDNGALSADVPARRLFGIQLADTLADPWDNVRDECMAHRQLPGAGAGELARRLGELAALGPLPPVGIELFTAEDEGSVLAGVPTEEAARLAYEALARTMTEAGL